MHSTNPEAERVLEWHRVDTGALGALALGALILFLGPSFGAIAFIVFKHQPALELGFAIAGGVCVVVGPTLAILRLARSLREDASIAARKDGITFERNGKKLHVPWDDIERVEHEPPITIVVRRRSTEPFVLHERFAVVEPGELARRLEELRRKAAFGLL